MNIQESLKNLTYGVYTATVNDGNKSTGCIVNSLIQVTYNTVAVSINHNNYTNECIKKSKHFAISILPEDIDENIIPTFGFQSGRSVNKFENIEKITISNLDIIPNCVAYRQKVSHLLTIPKENFLGLFLEFYVRIAPC